MSRDIQTDSPLKRSQPLSLRAADTAAAVAEDSDYLCRQLITYIGNKRSLLGQISAALERIKRRLGKARLNCFDVFSGSGVVARFLKAHSDLLISNDLEDYAAVIGRCYLANRSSVDIAGLTELVRAMNEQVMTAPLPKGFIEDMYSPQDESKITKDDRVFYTRSNARRLDNYRRFIADAPKEQQDFLLGPLLSEASIHANTAGVFKGFYKNRHTHIGQFGGSGSDALLRILGDITLDVPVLSNFECDVQILREDANKAVRHVRGLDLAYLDPPYNQHPYGSNYFMLNLLVHYERPERVSRVSGIPPDWRRSGYNVRSESFRLLSDLVEHTDATFLLISFNNEGFISPNHMRQMLAAIGHVEVIEMPYNAFRGCRNFDNRSIHTTEHLFLVERR